MGSGLITAVRQTEENGTLKITVTVELKATVAGDFPIELTVPGPLEEVKSQTQKALFALGSELAKTFDGLSRLT